MNHNGYLSCGDKPDGYAVERHVALLLQSIHCQGIKP